MDLLLAGSLALVAGIVFGIFGAGGSILLVPILVYVLDVPIKQALGMALIILTFTGLAAAIAHARSRNVSWWIGVRWAITGIPAAYLGGRVAEFIPEHVLIMMFAVVVMAAASAMIWRPQPKTTIDPRHIPMGKVLTVGFVLGFLTGMIGTGGGFLLVPALVLLCGLNLKHAIGTSLLIIAINSLGGSLGFAAHENFDWPMTLIVAAFNIVGSLIGERIGKPLPSQKLRPAFGVFLLLVGAVMVVENVLHLVSH